MDGLQITYLEPIQCFPSIRTLESVHAATVEPAVLPINDLSRAGNSKSFHGNEKKLEGQLRLISAGVASNKGQNTETTIVH